MNPVVTAQVREQTVSPPRSVSIWLGLSAFTVLMLVPFLLKPPCPDVATFDYVGWLAGRGQTLYVDVIEQNWPGVIWLHTLSSLLFGNHLWSFRVVDFALLLVGCAGLFQLASVGASPATRYLVVPLYQLIYVSTDVWMTGQRDMLVSHVLLAVAALAVARMRGGPVGLPLLIGAAMAFASLTRPTSLLFLPLIYAVDALTCKDRRTLMRVGIDLLLSGLAYVTMLGSVALIGSFSGALQGWYQAAVVFNTMLYSQTAALSDLTMTMWTIAMHYHWLVMLAVVGLALWARRGERRVLLITLCLVLTGIVSTFVQGKGFGYHMAMVYAALSLFAAEAIGAALAYAKRQPTRLANGLAVLACGVALLGGTKKFLNEHADVMLYLTGRIDRERLNDMEDLGLGVSVGDALRAAEYARTHTTPEQTVLPWNRAVVINYLAERKLPTKLATVGVLDILRDSFAPGRVWMQSFEETLRADPPALIFTYNEYIRQEHDLLWKSDASLPATALVREALRSRYRRVARFGALDAYALQ